MADGTSGAERVSAVGDAAPTPMSSRASERAPLRFDRIVIIGGGCYGSWYAQQLTRAAQRGALFAQEVVVVDRDARCQVATRQDDGAYNGLPVRVETAEWNDYLATWLSAGTAALRADAMVPSPLMPHLCLDWLLSRARTRWPSREVRVDPLAVPPDMPWQRAAPDGRHYVSFATWQCPVNCIEPSRCPATKGARDWSLPVALTSYVEGSASPSLRGPVIFHCVHRTYGVGMIDAAAIAQADDDIAAWGAEGNVSALVGTVSHCHGALGVLSVS